MPLYNCELCNYKTEYASNFINHKKTKKHINNLSLKSITNKDNYSFYSIPKVSSKYHDSIIDDTSKIIEKSAFNCEKCNSSFTQKNNYYRHRKNCNISINYEKELLKKEFELKESNLKLEIAEKEKELFKKLEKEKSDLLNNFMSNANVLLNKANDNTKITAQTLQTVSSSALKYANEKFKDTPALLPIDNFNINNLDFNNEEDKKQLVELLIYNAKQKSLDKLLGNHIIKYYKKENPEEQSFHTTDCSRLNYILRELIENALIWSVDKNGIKICSSIVKPLIKKCIDALMEQQKLLLHQMSLGEYGKQKEVELIIDILMSIDSGTLESDINKYIAPFFNLNKLENLNP